MSIGEACKPSLHPFPAAWERKDHFHRVAVCPCGSEALRTCWLSSAGETHREASGLFEQRLLFWLEVEKKNTSMILLTLCPSVHSLTQERVLLLYTHLHEDSLLFSSSFLLSDLGLLLKLGPIKRDLPNCYWKCGFPHEICLQCSYIQYFTRQADLCTFSSILSWFRFDCLSNISSAASKE